MPRGRRNHFDSALSQLQKQAWNASRPAWQIRAADELARPRKEASTLSGLVGSFPNSRPVAARRRTRKGGRLDWSKVLQRLPKQFKAANVRAVRCLKDKRSSEIFVAITRWIDSGAVKRRERGTYQRVKA